MTRKTLIKRLGLTSGITIVAASGVLVATAAGGTSHPTHHQRPAACLTHRASTRCDHRGRYGIRHQRTIQHSRHGSGYAVRNRTGQQRWGGCCDMWRNQATAGSASRNGYRHSGSRSGGYHHQGDRHSGSHGGRDHRGDRHWGGGGYGRYGGGHGDGC